MRRFLLAALWMWPSWASSQGTLPGTALLELNDQVFEGILALRPPPTTTGSTVIMIERRHIREGDCEFCVFVPDPPAFLIINRTIRDSPHHPPRDVTEDRLRNAPAPPDEGTRVRVYIQGGKAALICPLNSEAPRTPACERRNELLGVWQSVQGRIDAAKAQGEADTLLQLAGSIAKTDPSSAVQALFAAMDLGALPAAGSRASEILMAQARYPEAAAVLDQVIAAQGPTASPDLIARRELARAVSGLPFDASKVDFSHSTLTEIHLGPVTLHDRVLDGVVWRNGHMDHVDLSGLRTESFEVDHGTLDHISFHGAGATVAAPLSEQAGRAGRALVVPPNWDGKTPAPTFESVVRNASGTAITAFALRLTRSPFKLHASIADSDFSDASLPFAEINGRRDVYSPGEAATQRTTFERSDLEAAGFGGHLDQVSFNDAKLDWAQFTQATLDHVSFDGASLAGAEFSVVQFHGVDFSHAKLWQSDPTVEGVLHRLNNKLVLDPVLGLRFDPSTFGRSTYDCETKWPLGFEPAQYGLIPMRSSCVDRRALDFDDVTISGLSMSKDVDLSGASFRGADVRVFCQGGSLRETNFTNAVLSGSASGCNLADARFDHASVSASLVGATLAGTRFIDSTIGIDAIASFPFAGFWTHRPPDPSQRALTDLLGATFERSHLSCTLPSFASANAVFHDGNEGRIVATLRKLQERGLSMDESCQKAFPIL